ncbi:lycopene cyclase domain-containing protein [Marinoscillum pacificum]|uniref:lycopene cyclase domain-containing protein n=1 Tax=Marinoscillum pacificum TaxID=392723 RepID=UPI0021589EB4|nr:lycopene cyclase domain-containing protein [Marinoscillum pacificum]
MKYLYFILHLFTVSFPLLRSFEPRIKYAKKWNALFIGIAITGAFFIAWDILFTRIGVWGFNSRYLMGVYIFNLPIEEILFFITVPFASVFIYECVIYFLPRIQTNKFIKINTGLIGFLLLIFAVLNFDRLYTFWNFLFAGIFLIYTGINNPDWLGKFWTAYLIHLVPFVLVNGVLTGYGLEEPIVWYNNEENLGIRLITIPIEDTMYALLLLLMNVTFYEKFKQTTKQNP